MLTADKQLIAPDHYQRIRSVLAEIRDPRIKEHLWVLLGEFALADRNQRIKLQIARIEEQLCVSPLQYHNAWIICDHHWSQESEASITLYHWSQADPSFCK